MNSQDDVFFKQLQATFRVEAKELVDAMTAGLFKIERPASEKHCRDEIETLYRATHSLKGAAAGVNDSRIESVCQGMEEVLGRLKKGKTAPGQSSLNVLHGAVDAINLLVAPTGAAESQPSRPVWRNVVRELAQLNDACHGPPDPLIPVLPRPINTRNSNQEPVITNRSDRPPTETQAVAATTVRINADKLDRLLSRSEELLMAKVTASRRAAGVGTLTSRMDAWRKEWVTASSDVLRLRRQFEKPEMVHLNGAATARLSSLFTFLDWTASQMDALNRETATLHESAIQDHRSLENLVDDLLVESKNLLLLPFGSISISFAKIVRDLCQQQGKEADLDVHGEETEVDKRILETVKGPLIHLLRNSVDHGVETPDQRRAAGKPDRASIQLTMSAADGNRVEILIADDGAGIHADAVRKSAIRSGLLTEDAGRGLDLDQVHSLIFEPGLSTSSVITTVSGRGLGMAIAREKIEMLGGSVSVTSCPGKGTSFRILVPATLSAFRGILVSAGGKRYVLPIVQVERVARVAESALGTVEGRDTVSIGESVFGFANLDAILEQETPATQATDHRQVVIVSTGEHRLALGVDEVLEEREWLVKSFRKPLLRVRNIAAVTVPEPGKLIPVLNIPDLFKAARQLNSKAGGQKHRTDAKRAKATGTVLVAEDSITSRTLLKSVLESAGYRVKTAIDGMEAFTLLRSEPFDVLVSDVEMPRLNGFDLATKVRADRRLIDLPIILVTARENPDDREKGIDAGANAYLVKSSFDQNNLIETIKRLTGIINE